ncbi:hypothetical protein B488_03710 [Liberibacter crescens BT-1]|uniref:Uncharacterized protein n=1 Tax=Liberibacter crescens (strain BT-1) TaxID=1215343 RepID=L0ES84_LIBCB|nr:hypothetical protein B488_03710 [Liberibacter crescens BT-1]
MSSSFRISPGAETRISIGNTTVNTIKEIVPIESNMAISLSGL